MASTNFSQISPLSVKAELVGILGSKGRPYWNTLSEFIKAKISRAEFEDRVAEWLDTPHLTILHNSLITALIYSASDPNPEWLEPPNRGLKPRSRPRLHAHEKDQELRNLRRWAVYMGRLEREQILTTAAVSTRTSGTVRNKRGEVVRTSRRRNEMRSERGVRLMKERGNPPGTHIPIPLCGSTGLLPTEQNLFDRMSLIASQHDMTCSKTAVALLMTSLDANLKRLSARAIDLSDPSISRVSIFNAGRANAIGRTVTGEAVEMVLTLAPFEVPGSSASTLSLGDHGYRKPGAESDSGTEKEEDEGHGSMLIDSDSPEHAQIIIINEDVGFQEPDVGATENLEVYKNLISQNTNSLIATMEEDDDYYAAANDIPPEFEPSRMATGTGRGHQHFTSDAEGLFPEDDQFPIMIGSTTSAEQIIQVLTQRGCSDLTPEIDSATCSEFPIAGGGFCDVYRGIVACGINVAIKSLRLYDVPGREQEKNKILKRAARELYYWSKLKHPNVLPLKGLAMFRGHMSMVSEWMENGSLMAYIRQNPSANRIDLCNGVCAGLAYIHAKNMAHGDLKAANVMISSSGTPLIADFGSAQLRDLTLKFTNTTKTTFTLRWAAPELLDGGEIDVLSEPSSDDETDQAPELPSEDNGPPLSKEADVYAYGMTVLETLTGKVPFADCNEQQVLVMVYLNRKTPDRPKVGVNDEIWEILQRCWAWDPSERPSIATVQEQLLALTTLLKSQTRHAPY